MFDVMKEILISEKDFTETNYKKLQKALVYVKNNLIDSDGGMHLTKIKKVLQLIMLFKKFQMNLIVNQTKHGQIKGVNFTIDQ